jgi:hypothetical protein
MFYFDNNNFILCEYENYLIARYLKKIEIDFVSIFNLWIWHKKTHFYS